MEGEEGCGPPIPQDLPNMHTPATDPTSLLLRTSALLFSGAGFCLNPFGEEERHRPHPHPQPLHASARI